MEQIANPDINDRVIKVRKFLGMTQGEFAERAGLSRSFVGKVEAHKQSPSFKFIYCIHSCYNVSLDYLVAGTAPMFITESPENMFEYFQGVPDEYIQFTRKMLELNPEDRLAILNLFFQQLDLYHPPGKKSSSTPQSS